METDKNESEIIEICEEPLEVDKKSWDNIIKFNAPEIGILSLLMLLNDIFLKPYFQTLVNKLLIKKYRNLVMLCHIFQTSNR
ncbi:MAG: hypothetical protein ACTSRG_02090 [Candidatus Helarchaeota archaeon]